MLNKIAKFLPALLAVCLMTAAIVVVPTAYAAESDANQTGASLDFYTTPPQTKTVCDAGEGRVTYEPTGNNSAVITMDNATAETYFRVSYNGPNYVNTALAATGDITLVLVGENTVYIDPSNSCSPLFFYDANVTVKGEGSLKICFKDETVNFNVIPFQVHGNFGLENSTLNPLFADTGNFTMESGNLIISAKGSSSAGALTVDNNITVKGGNITSEGRASGVYSVYRDVIALGGEIKCTEFTANGIYARRGGIRVDGAEITLESEQDRYVFGMYSEVDQNNITENAGKITVEIGEVNIKSPYLGIYARGNPILEGSGSISISGGTVNVECKSEQSLLAGIYAEISDNSPGGKVQVTGGVLDVRTQSGYTGQKGYSVGICATGTTSFTGCNVYADAVGGEDVEAYAVSAGSIFLECSFSLGGTTGATDVLPEFGNGIVPSASRNGADGETEQFDPENYGAYKFIKYEMPAPPVSDPDGLSAGAVAGIAAGSSAVALISIIVIILVVKRRKI